MGIGGAHVGRSLEKPTNSVTQRGRPCQGLGYARAGGAGKTQAFGHANPTYRQIHSCFHDEIPTTSMQTHEN